MRFSTNSTWPRFIRATFESEQQEDEGLESRYYGSYNLLLSHCFDNPDTFVKPQAPPNHLSRRQSVDFVVKLCVANTVNRPVLFLEVKDDASNNSAKLRFKAADQIRQRFQAMLPYCPLPRLYGLSVIGTSLRVYVGDVATGTVEPGFANWPGSARNVPPDFLEDGWNMDILSREGFQRMKEIVDDIRTQITVLKRTMI